MNEKPAEKPTNCRYAGPGRGQCFECANGYYERCLYLRTEEERAAQAALRKARRAAERKLLLRSDKMILEHLDFAGMDALEAYKCGVEEAQSEIVNRLALLERAL